MKKQTLKKRTKKIGEGETVAKKKDFEDVIRKSESEISAENNNYGITLIALVITVIVLLILAGISISILSGDNAILSRAGEAKTKTEYGKAQEALSLAYAEAVGDRYLNNSTTAFESEVVQKLQSAGYTIGTEASGSAQIELSSTSVTLEEGGNTEEVIATIKADTKYMLVDGLYYPLTITNSTATLGTEGQSELSGSSISLSDLILNTTGSITANLNTTTGVITITSGSVISDNNKVELFNNETNYGTINVSVIKNEHIADKSYVDYNVSYTDVYTGTEYRSDTGWRLLTDLSSTEESGTYEGDIEIISTGIPAKLYYNYSKIKDFEIENDLNNSTKGKWTGNSTQRSAYLDSENGGFNYTNRSTNDNNIYAASGLLYNFENIVFNIIGTTSTLITGSGSGTAFEIDSTKNYGGYIAISNGGSVVTASGNTTGASLFRVSNLASGTIPTGGIRSVTLKDIKGTNDDSNTTRITTSVDINGTNNADKRKGLFRLDQYDPDKHSSSGYYWLASPCDVSGYGSNLRYIDYRGIIGYTDFLLAYGVRPVISISNVKLQLKGNVWKIVK